MTERELAMLLHPAGKGREMNTPAVGDTVHYTINGECYTAIVMHVSKGLFRTQLDLLIRANDGIANRTGVSKAQVQRCGEPGNPGTWHRAEQPLGVPAVDAGLCV